MKGAVANRGQPREAAVIARQDRCAAPKLIERTVARNGRRKNGGVGLVEVERAASRSEFDSRGVQRARAVASSGGAHVHRSHRSRLGCDVNRRRGGHGGSIGHRQDAAAVIADDQRGAVTPSGTCTGHDGRTVRGGTRVANPALRVAHDPPVGDQQNNASVRVSHREIARTAERSGNHGRATVKNGRAPITVRAGQRQRSAAYHRHASRAADVAGIGQAEHAGIEGGGHIGGDRVSIGHGHIANQPERPAAREGHRSGTHGCTVAGYKRASVHEGPARVAVRTAQDRRA